MKPVSHQTQEPHRSLRGRSSHARSRRWRLRFAQQESGQATVEFAVVAVVFLLIVTGILFFGRLLNYDMTATHLAEEAARFAAVDQPGPGGSICNTIKNQIGFSNPTDHDVKSGPTVSFSFPNGTTQPGIDPVRVTITFQFGFLPLLNLGNVTVNQTATELLEQTPSSTVYGTTGTCP